MSEDPANSPVSSKVARDEARKTAGRISFLQSVLLRAVNPEILKDAMRDMGFERTILNSSIGNEA
jgi:hypothetical protein